MKHALFAGSAFAAFVFIPAAALAQDAVADAATTATSPTAPEQSGNDIVVTAQRTRSLASKTPIALSAISGDALRGQGVTNPVQLAEQVPNLTINRNQGLQITIRGVSSRDQSEKGDPSAAFLSDGIYIARPQAQEVSFFDIDRVEVLRGPQGTLYGKNTTAGVVNIITKRPDDHFSVQANAGYGNYETYQADAAVNVPVSNLLALRFSGSYDRRDSYLIALPGQQKDVDPFKNNLSGRAQALFTFSPDLSLLLRADYSRMRGVDSWPVVAGRGLYYDLETVPGQSPYADPINISAGKSSRDLRTMGYNVVAPFSARDHSWGIGGELNWTLGDVTFTYLGSYREYKLDHVNSELIGVDASTGNPNPNSVRSDVASKYRQHSHEVRAAFDQGPIKAQAGAIYFREDARIDYVYSNAYGFSSYGFYQDPVVNESYGFFGQATYSVTQDLRITGGARYSHDRKKRQGLSLYQAAPGGAFDIDAVNDAAASYSKVTWRAGVEADLDPRTLLYATVATGYKAGGFNDGCARGSVLNGVACDSTSQAVNPAELYYNPETLTSYEIGLKTRTADNMLRLTIDGFYYDYSNMQLQAQRLIGGNLRTIFINAPATVKGVEAEATLAPSDRNSINLAFTWLDAKYKNFNPVGQLVDGSLAAVSFRGRQLDRAPKYTVSAAYNYTLPLAGGSELVASVRTRLNGSYAIADFVQARQYRQPAFTRTEASLTYNAPNARWYIQGYVKNIENDVQVSNISYSYIPGLYSQEVLVTPTDPRTYGVRVGFKY